MQWSFWETKNWLSNIDFAIVGSGIVGLQCALQLRKKYPNSKIIILEKGILPQGASTKNAGFACFGSISEIISDLKTHTETEVAELVQKRYDGLQILLKQLGKTVIGYKNYGGYEVFLEQNNILLEKYVQQMPSINGLLKPIFRQAVFEEKNKNFGFQKTCKTMIYNNLEGQIDTGNLMQTLLKKAIANNILILNNQIVTAFTETQSGVEIATNHFTLFANKLFFATNGFAAQLLNVNVQPARAQVLITKPIVNLPIKGTFHMEEGYYYFRNFGNRILFGGGRNLDFAAETTTTFSITPNIQNQLQTMLKEIILPNTNFEIEQQWSGIMGVGKQKKPIVKQLSNNVFCGVRLGGMGVAIGSLVGAELADLLS